VQLRAGLVVPPLRERAFNRAAGVGANDFRRKRGKPRPSGRNASEVITFHHVNGIHDQVRSDPGHPPRSSSGFSPLRETLA
jgi:hypothetical protein